MNTAEKTHSEEQAASQMDSIRELVEALNTKNETKREAAEQAIQEDALEIAISDGWHRPCEKPDKTEYKILLFPTGEFRVRITGDLNQYNEPETARLEHQDRGKAWTEYHEADKAVLLEYARQFYFGE